MPLEDLVGSDKYLDALNKDWPLDDDDRPEGDDHIRGVKNVILNTFGPVAEAVAITRAMLWGVPATDQDQITGSTPMAMGTVAQRPATGNNRDMRWCLDCDPYDTIPILENWKQGAFVQVLAQLDVINLFLKNNVMNCGDQSTLPTDVPDFRFSNTRDPATLYARMRTLVTDDIDVGATDGSASFDISVLQEKELVKSIVIDLLGIALTTKNNAPLTLNGNEVLSAQNVAYESPLTAFALNNEYAFTHGLGYRPKLYLGYFVCDTADGPYSPGDELPFTMCSGVWDTSGGTDNAYTGLYVDSDTQIKCSVGSQVIYHVAPGGVGFMNTANWRLQVRAWA